ncbi:hypothetical protein D1872_342940 [compost metagenome]
MALDGERRQAQALGDGGKAQLIKAAEEKHLLNAAGQLFELRQQGIVSEVLGMGVMLKGQQ